MILARANLVAGEPGCQAGPVPETPQLIMYTRPGCPFSAKLKAKLALARIPYTPVDIWQDPDAAAIVRSVNDGNELVPTVRVGEVFLSNPTLRQVRAALAGR
jgi:glutaredoxin-like protein